MDKKQGRPLVNVLETVDYSHYFYLLSSNKETIKSLSKSLEKSNSTVHQRIKLMVNRGFVLIGRTNRKYNTKKPLLNYELLTENMLDMLIQYFDNSKKEIFFDEELDKKLIKKINALDYSDFMKFKDSKILQNLIKNYLRDACNNRYFHNFSLRDALEVLSLKLFIFDEKTEKKVKKLLTNIKDKKEYSLFNEFYKRYIKIMKAIHEYYPELRMMEDSVVKALKEV